MSPFSSCLGHFELVYQAKKPSKGFDWVIPGFCATRDTCYLWESMANNMTYEELVKKHPGSLVEKMVTEVVNKDTVEVYFEIQDDEQWSVIKVHVYEEDKEMALRLLSESRWVLQFGYYDDDDEFIELLQPLTQPEIDLIPKGLQKVMQRVLVSEEGLRLPGNFLSR
jgi:hypothetical protein